MVRTAHPTEAKQILETDPNSDKLQAILVKRIVERLREFPGYAKIPRVAVLDEPWTIESGLMTPTLKLRRQKILEICQSEIDWLYAGH